MTIIVIDDDPTGSQTVHSCPLLLRWDVTPCGRGCAVAAAVVLANMTCRRATAAQPQGVALERRCGAGLDPGDLVLVSGVIPPCAAMACSSRRCWRRN